MYLEVFRKTISARLRAFRPEILFWNWGYDGTKGEYGDIGLTPEVHISLTRELRELAEEISQGRLIIVLCGGSRRELARSLIPRMIEVLADSR